jgi:hypothetical protein
MIIGKVAKEVMAIEIVVSPKEEIREATLLNAFINVMNSFEFDLGKPAPKF